MATPLDAQLDTGTTAWMLTSTTLVLLMIPGLALFYGGLVRPKNVLGTMMHSFAAMAIIGVLWPVCGYALAFGESLGGVVGWSADKVMLSGIDDRAFGKIPEYVYCMFQGKFAIITPALIAGAFAERVRFGGYCLLITLWSLLIYSPLAHIIWGGGFLTGHAIDFAGGTVIHVSAGVAGLVSALYLGARADFGRVRAVPNNLVMMLTGAGLLWVGWFGFNAGSSVESSLKTGQALAMTQLSASAGALTWLLVESLAHRRATSVGLASGILAGLVAITPAAGDVRPAGALALGALGAVVSFGALRLKGRLGYDDTLDVFGIHGVAGVVGALGLTFFLRAPTAAGLWGQLWNQAVGVGVAALWGGLGTLSLLWLTERLVGLRLPAAEEARGMDLSLHGEVGYGLARPEEM
ncbi:MAG: ammonium transporter [Deltaproteobacteria bacterium]|nr:ammonium transporter [Deltaproteobacteria bacterium]